MDATTAAFSAPVLTRGFVPTRASRSISHRSCRTATPVRRHARMAADGAEPTDPVAPVAPVAPVEPVEVAEPEAVTSAQTVLNILREDSAKDGPNEVKSGLIRDVDGRSNMYALEPMESVDEKPQINKAAILAAVFACVALALLILPRLPFTNGDQF